MRSRIIVLLAVCSNIAAAGIIRHNGARTQHHKVARFLNHTELPSSFADIQSLTTLPIESSSITSSSAASQETSSFAATPSTAPAATPSTPDLASSSNPAADALTTSVPSQGLSTSAPLPTTLSTAAGSELSEAGSEGTPNSTETIAVQPAETLSRLFNPAGSPLANMQPSAGAQSFSLTSSPKLSASSPITSDMSSTTNNQDQAATSSAPAATQTSSSFKIPLTTASAGTSPVMSFSTALAHTSSTEAASPTSSPVVVPVPISSGPVQVLGAGGDTAEEFAPVTLDSSSPTPTKTVKYPTTDEGNTAMATGFNGIYKTLSEDSPCNPGDSSQAYACVDGEIAECQADETYVLKSCPQGQSCYALPKASDSTGIVVQCAVPSDAYSILAGLSPSTAGPVAVSSQPAQASQVQGGLDQTTQSVSVPNPVQPVTSSSLAQATIQSQTMAPTPTVLAVSATLSHDQSSEQVDEAAVSTKTSPTTAQPSSQSQSQAFDSPELAVTAPAQQVSDPNSLNGSPNSLTSPSVPSTTAGVDSIPNALFAVVTATGNDQAASSQDSKQILVPTSQLPQPSPAIATSIIQSSATSDLNGLQVTEASAISTSTSNADGAGITSTPAEVPVNEKVAVGNGQATVTVTMTVTTTERPAPVTVFS